MVTWERNKLGEWDISIELIKKKKKKKKLKGVLNQYDIKIYIIS